jgi:N-acetylmuramoyl-L-alanine amidase
MRILKLPVIILSTMLFAAVWTWAPSIKAQSAGKRITIAIDPGHGGQDSGARSPQGTLEKDLTMALARHLAASLDPQYHTVLTRSDDYHVENHKRSAEANYHRADLMISLHIGAGFQHAAADMTVYYYKACDSQADSSDRQEQDPIAWRKAQTGYTTASLSLAKQMQRMLESVTEPGGVHIQAAPLVVLQGVDLPAIVIEIGNLTNPAAEIMLASDDQLKRYAQAIARGVKAYLEPTPTTP